MFGLFKRKKKEPEIDKQLKALVSTINKKTHYVYSPNDLKGVEAFENLKKQSDLEQKQLILRLSEFIADVLITRAKNNKNQVFGVSGIFHNADNISTAMQGNLLRKKLNYTETEWIALFRGFRKCVNRLIGVEHCYFALNRLPVNYAIKQLEYTLKKREPSANLVSFIEEMLEWKEFRTSDQNKHYYGSDLSKATRKLKEILRKEDEDEEFYFKTEDIGKEVNSIVDSIDENKGAFVRIFNLAVNVSGSKPTKKFSKEVIQLQDIIGPQVYRKIAHEILSVLFNHNTTVKKNRHTYQNRVYEHTAYHYLCDKSQQFAKGIVWTMDWFSDKETIRILSKVFEKAFTKLPERGPAAGALGNACVYVLGNMRGKDGLGALSRLKLKVRQNNVKKIIDRYLSEVAEKYNVSVEELKEMSVPDFNLLNGSKEVMFQDYALKIHIEGSKVSQQWIKPDGNTMKSVPSLVRKEAKLSNKLKETRKEVKEIQKVLSAQKQRIDNLFIIGRSWDFPSFQKYYLDNGLVYPLTQKLIWIFKKGNQSTDAILYENRWCNIDLEVIKWIDNTTTVELWHPVNASESAIIGWREKMMELEWKQPIKQAFREIYILTDAEVNTRVYSNRMAAHILKQHQFSTLANLRGWKYALLGAYDHGLEGQVCHKYLPDHNITAEYWIDEIYDDGNWNDTGIWYHIATDQVKFKDGNDEVMELANVPRIVFTEIMRDVDMFVGVCSVGNDPLWMDNNGQRQANRDYWTTYSFGDLTEIAKTRKVILERLLPRLKKIRDKARIDGKFLIVEGSIRTYKIHIGSGNILMEPNDQYLCIVPARSAENTTDRLFVPFEGDKGLSIVLSKAFLLAEDSKITDTTITSQIKRS